MADDLTPPDADTAPENEPRDLALERRLREVVANADIPSEEIREKQVAAALAAFRATSTTARRLRVVSASAAAIVLAVGVGWWGRSVTEDRPVAATATLGPIRGLTAPCASVVGIYVGTTTHTGRDVAVYVQVSATEVHVRLVDTSTCTVISVLP